MKKLIYGAFDFETTGIRKSDDIEETYEEYREKVKKLSPEVYSWGLKIQGEDYIDGIDLSQFIYEITHYNRDLYLYAHFGSKFDNHFITKYLINNGWTQVVDLPSNYTVDEFLNDYDQGENLNLKFIPKINNYSTIIFQTKNQQLLDLIIVDFPEIKNIRKKQLLDEFEYKLHVGDAGKIINMQIASFEKTRSNKRRIVTIRDSFLMFSSPLAKLGETLNKNYNTDIYSKGAISYNRSEKYKDYDEFKNDGNEKAYLEQDVNILFTFMEMLMEVLPFHKWKNTAAGTTFRIWKYEYFGKKLLENAVEKGTYSPVTSKKGLVKYVHKNGKKPIKESELIDSLLDKFLPTKWLNDNTINLIDNDFDVITEAFQGGLTGANPVHTGKVMNNLLYIDINSSYPQQMRNNWFPAFNPVFTENKNNLNLYRLTAKTTLKNEKGLPFLYDYLKEGEGKYYSFEWNGELLITDVELERVKKYYSGEFDYNFVVGFNKIHGEQLFGDFIDYFYLLKSKPEVSEAEKLFAKLMLNALYGKFGQDVVHETSLISEFGYESYSTVSKANLYFPIAIWITAYARLYLVDAVDENYELVVYKDTDSLSILVPFDVLNTSKELMKEWIENNFRVKIDDNKLGYWDIEHIITQMIARRAKQYRYSYLNEKTGEIVKNVKIAGIRMSKSDIENLSNEEFVLGKKGIVQKRPMKNNTGIAIEEYLKNIKPIWDYNLNPSYWYQNEKEYLDWYIKNKNEFN